MCIYCWICAADPDRFKNNFEFYRTTYKESEPVCEYPFFRYLNLNLLALGTLDLQRFAMISLAVGIWSQPKWNSTILDYVLQNRKKKNLTDWHYNWIPITESAFEDVRKLNVPVDMIDELEFIVEMVGHELLSFLQYYKNYSYSNRNFICVEKIAWTSFGTIDKLKTHHNFMYKSSIPHVKSACPLCIDDKVIRMWVRISRNKTSTQPRSYFKLVDEASQLVMSWGNVYKNAICRLQLLRDSNKALRYLTTINEKMAFVSAQDGNIEVFTYFWQKMSYKERHATLPLIIQTFNPETIQAESYLPFTEILLYILRNSQEIIRKAIVARCGFILITGMLQKWPYYGIIVHQFGRILPRISIEDYNRIVPEILSKMHSIEFIRVKHDYYRHEFSNLWENMDDHMAKTSKRVMYLRHPPPWFHYRRQYPFL